MSSRDFLLSWDCGWRYSVVLPRPLFKVSQGEIANTPPPSHPRELWSRLFFQTPSDCWLSPAPQGYGTQGPVSWLAVSSGSPVTPKHLCTWSLYPRTSNSTLSPITSHTCPDFFLVLHLSQSSQRKFSAFNGLDGWLIILSTLESTQLC